MIPCESFFEVEYREQAENHQCDDFLHRLELRCRIDLVSDTIGRHGQKIFEQRNTPTDEDDRHQWRAGEFQMPVPGKSHENIGADQKQDR